MASSTVAALSAASALDGTELYYGVQGGANVKVTGVQLKTLILGAGSVSIANGKTLTVSNILTLAGTDGSTLNVGAGGTLGSNAFTSTGYLPLAGGTLVGSLLFTDATYDIGASGATRPRNIFASGTGTFGGLLTGSAGITVASGQVLKLGNAAVTGLTAGVLAALTNATIVITDSTGQAYRIPCII